MLKLLERFTDQPVMTGIVLPQERLATARAGAGAVAQSVILVISHHDASRPVLDHVPDQMQRLTDARSAVNDVTNEYGLAPGMLIDAVNLAVTHLVQ